MSIVIITSEVNRGGFRTLPEGVRLDRYKKNPILLFMHRRSTHWDKENNRLPIGKIENVRLENGRIIADDPIFDMDDEFAKQVANKWEKGMLNAVSPGLSPLTVSDDPQYVLQGQTRPTLVISELLEISIVDIPKDGDAVRLSLENDETIDNVLPKLNLSHENKKPEMDFKNIAIQLGLGENATEADILNAIKQKNVTVEKLQADKVKALLAQGREKGIITDANEPYWEKMANADYDTTLQLMNDQKPVEEKEEKKEEITMAGLLKLAKSGNDNSGDTGRKDWDFNKWSQEDPEGLNEMRLNQPEEYEKLQLKGDKIVNGFTIEK